jgi:large subunit ribosomal protein L4
MFANILQSRTVMRAARRLGALDLQGAVMCSARASPTFLVFRALSSEASLDRVLPSNLKIDPRSSFAPPIDISSDLASGDDDDADADEEEIEVAEAIKSYLTEREIFYAVPLPERLHVKVHTLFAPEHSSEVGTIWLDESVFGRDPVRVDLLKRAVDYYRSKKRGVRNAVTKTISQVSGSGRKIRQQKGTGSARAGHSRPPHFRGGAKAHGPKNITDYGNTKLNKKVRKQALAAALTQKLKEGNLIIWDQLHELATHKTADFVRLLEPWDIGSRDGSTALILDHYEKEGDEDSATSYQGVPSNLWVASSNLFKVTVGNDHAANVYDILKHEKLVLTLEALQQIEGRLKDV